MGGPSGGRLVRRRQQPPGGSRALRLLAASRQQPLWTGPAAAGEAAARTTLLGATPHFSERFPFVNDCMFLFVSREVTQLYPPCSARATGDVAHFVTAQQQPTWRSTLSSPGSYSNMPIGGAQGPRQVVVLGMHHSGTSIVTKLLRDAGLYLGEDSELAWSKSNPLKYFERLDVNELNRLLLGGSDVARSRRHSRAPDWVHHGTDPQAILAGSATLRETALAEISRIVSMLDGPTGKRLWAIKASAGCPPSPPRYLRRLTD